MSTVATASPYRWIAGPGYDQFFLAASWLVPFALWGVALTLPYGLLVALAIFVLLDNSHQVATLPLTIFDPGSMQRSGRFYLGGIAVIGSTAVALSFFPGSLATRFWASLVLYWGAWHIIRQHYGFLRLYQARDKPVSERLARAEAVALYSGAAFPYLMNLSHGWAAHGIGELLVRIPFPVWSAWLVLAIFVASMGFVLTDVVTRMAKGEDALSLRLLHLVLAVSNFWFALLLVGREDLILATLFITSYHDVQYHAIVWLVGHNRAANEAAPVVPAVRRMFASRTAFAAAIVVGALLQAFLRNDFQLASSLLPDAGAVNAAVFALFTSYSYMHYFIDGRMWKMGQDPRLRVELGLVAAPVAAAPRRPTRASRRR